MPPTFKLPATPTPPDTTNAPVVVETLMVVAEVEIFPAVLILPVASILPVTNAFPPTVKSLPIAALTPTDKLPVKEAEFACNVLKRLLGLPRFELIFAVGVTSEPRLICATLLIVANVFAALTFPTRMLSEKMLVKRLVVLPKVYVRLALGVMSPKKLAVPFTAPDNMST